MLLVEKQNLKKDIFKKNEFDYIYFGSLSEGTNLKSEVTFQSILDDSQKISDFKAFSKASSENQSENTFNYAVTNIQDEKSLGDLYSHNFQVAKGNSPSSIIHFQTSENKEILRSNILSLTKNQKGNLGHQIQDLKGESSMGLSI